MKIKYALVALAALALAALAALTITALSDSRSKVASARATPKWFTDLDEAKAVAAKENKPLLVDFTGSDWCGFCIKLHAEVFDKPEFEEFAKNYVLVELDFPTKKPQPESEKAKNKAIGAKFAVSGFPTILLLDAKTGEAYGRVIGYSPGIGPKAYLDKLSVFKNTAEGRAKLLEESKQAAEASVKRSAQGAKVRAALEAKDFDAVCKLIDETFADAQGPRKAVASFNKAMMSQRIDPANKERALKWADQALAEAAGDEKMVASMKSLRDRIANGTNLSQPTPAAPKAGSQPAAEVKPAAEAKKGG
jgi:protein disulfide-isomerase